MNWNFKNKSTFVKGLLSLWILYHLFAIVVFPNGSSFLGRRLQNYLLPYGNTLGLNTTWNFFSPDPAHTMYFEYIVNFEDEMGKEISPSVQGYFPPEKQEIVVDSSKRRLLYAMRFLALDSRRLQVLMGPWLCRQHPGASRVNIRHVVEQIPPLDVVVANSSLSASNMRQEVQSQNFEYDCRHAPDEVAL